MKTPSANTERSAERNGCRDRELLHYVGRQGVVTVEHVMRAMGAGRSVTYDRVARCIELGLLERHEVLRTEPAILRATCEGLEYARLGLPVASISPGKVEHELRCADVALMLAEEVGLRWIATEREIALVEQHSEEPVASIPVEPLPSGKFRRHRADMTVRRPSGQIEAVEVELSPKAPRRLERIISGWEAAEDFSAVIYYCRPGKTYRGVERAIARVGANEKVRLLTLEEA